MQAGSDASGAPRQDRFALALRAQFGGPQLGSSPTPNPKQTIVVTMDAANKSSEFPDRFDYAEALERIYSFWEDGGYFHAEPDSDKEPFTIVIPPPNVTGALHLGHALNNTLQDIQIRMRRMQGYQALWMPGTDHAGIATQAVVERRLKEDEGKTRHDLGRDELVRRIWAWKDQFETRIIGQLKRMGCSCDWERTRFTLDETCAAAVRHTFFDLFKKQRIYRGKRLVNWDTHLRTAVSDDEVEKKKVKGHFWHFKYPVIDPREGEPEFVTIATTRPETMLGDTAVAVHPNPAAALDKLESQLKLKLEKSPVKDRTEVQSQIDNIRQRREEMLPQLCRLREMAEDGRMIRLPLVDRDIPLIADAWAKPELGSGAVKITPAHDPNDYEVGKRAELPMVNVMNMDGTMNADAGSYEGLAIKKARAKVVADLDELGLLVEVEDREIELPHSDRSKTPIEPLLADQWFVKMDELAQSAIDAVEDERVQIFPTRYRRGYVDWLAEKRDWPVSRQLWWGHRIPVWCKVFAEKAELQTEIARLDSDPDVQSGVIAYQVELSDERDNATRADSLVELPHATVHLSVQANNAEVEARIEAGGYAQEDDVLDTWFSSALWPHSTLGWPEDNPSLRYFYPTTTLITSRDIITLWVARMVLAGLNNMGEIPFREVFIHPKILDGDGETMSKSKGNGIDPLDVIDKFGPDALRYGMAHLTADAQDVRMPIQFECPHCENLIAQTRKNRELPVIDCPKCDGRFSTQWARTDEDQAQPRGAVVSERFEQARNFCNKLWNASRFVMLQMESFQPKAVEPADLEVEDRWLLSRLATVTGEFTGMIERYQYSQAVRCLYDFAWDEFCSFYVEMTKDRLQNESARQTAQAVLAHSLDILLRLLHPILPFITEEIWQLLNQAAPKRGVDSPQGQSESIMVASWPAPDATRVDAQIEEQFALFQLAIGKVREIRSRQNIAPKETVPFAIKCSESAASMLKPMDPHFRSLANAQATAWGPDVAPPPTNATVVTEEMEIYVDLKDFIDVEAELARLEKQEKQLEGWIKGAEAKLSNESFVSRAPAHVVQAQRESLAQKQDELASVRESLAKLRSPEA